MKQERKTVTERFPEARDSPHHQNEVGGNPRRSRDETGGLNLSTTAAFSACEPLKLYKFVYFLYKSFVFHFLKLLHTGKLFAKIYNVFYCSKKAEAAAVADESDEAGRLREEWFEAVKSENLVKIEQLLNQGLDINTADEHGWTGLHLCAWNDHPRGCKILLDKSCDVDALGVGGSSALSLAAQKGHIGIVKLLLDAHCNIFTTATLGESSDVTALHLAAQNGHTDIVRLLLAAGAVVNAHMTVRDIQGVTPLHVAVEAGHLDIMDLLIEAGCDVHSSTQATSDSLC